MLERLIALVRRMGLLERLFAVLVLVIVVEFAANWALFDRINAFELQEDDAERIAEHVLLAQRSLDETPPAERKQQSKDLSTTHFTVKWDGHSKMQRGSLALSGLRAQIVDIEPQLSRMDLDLHLEPLPGSDNIGGAFRLSDYSVVRFQTHAKTAWKLSFGRLATMILPMLILIGFAWLSVRGILGPLRHLIGATRRLGAGLPQPVPEKGPDELRELIRALNAMQERIHQSLADRTQTMLAIGHDLKTPLSRMRLRLDDENIDPEVREGINHDIDEMRMLLDSLQAYVDSDGRSITPQLVNLAVMVETLVDTAADHGADVTYSGLSHLELKARPVAIRRAVSNLIENAVHYAGNARVSLLREGDYAVVRVQDDGPGIPPDRLQDAQQPFVRLDTARQRDTAGMGLGLAIVTKAVAMENGSLHLENRPEGGLRATIRLPLSS